MCQCIDRSVKLLPQIRDEPQKTEILADLQTLLTLTLRSQRPQGNLSSPCDPITHENIVQGLNVSGILIF